MPDFVFAHPVALSSAVKPKLLMTLIGVKLGREGGRDEFFVFITTCVAVWWAKVGH